MAINPVAIGTLGGYYFSLGAPSIKPELKGAKYTAKKKGSGLDVLVQTPTLGDFEIKIIRNSKTQCDLDEINYSNAFISKMNVFANTGGAIIPATGTFPFEYKISVKNKNIDVSVKHISVGKTNIRVQPDRSGAYHIRRVSFYDKTGTLISTYIPPTRKPKPTAPTSTSSSPGTFTGKPSP